MTYMIPGNPTALKRPRFSRMGHAYNSQRDDMFTIGMHLRSQYGLKPPHDSPLHLDITFFMPLPKNKKKRAQLLKQKWHTSRKDLDNLLKMLADCGNRILWEDDSLIASICARKQYDENPRTEFSITELKEE